MSRARPINCLIALRISFGLALWASPRPVGNASGFALAPSPQSAYLLRLLGARDVALACGLIVAATEDDRRRSLLVGLACDSADLLALLLALRGGFPKPSAAPLLGAALLRGAIALREQ